MIGMIAPEAKNRKLDIAAPHADPMASCSSRASSGAFEAETCGSSPCAHSAPEIISRACSSAAPCSMPRAR